ncbi:helix-turn-helix domain-containing protein [Roseateles sp.]|uniref:helix-turn-helix domain-containing protein n=1 Tax=Roseateles sp. TaxID=1971397 RepID=UPI003BA953F8
MYALHELSQAVRTRRQEIGLSQHRLAQLAGLSRATIVQLERGTLKDLSFTRTAAVLDVLGLGLTIGAAHPRLKPRLVEPTPPLELAARTASTSYARRLTAAKLDAALRTGIVPTGFEPHVHTLLEEAPVSLLAKLVEQLHAEAGGAREEVWASMRSLARELQGMRALWLE